MRYLQFALFPLLVVACSDQEPVAPDTSPLFSAAGPVVQTVTGSGHFNTPPTALIPGWRTFTMTARKYADGTVSGSFNRVTHPEDGEVTKGHGPITCFSIGEDGKTVWIGGEIPGAEPPDIVWQVVDNGEGAGADPDQVGLQLDAAFWGRPAGFAQSFCDEMPEYFDFGPFGGVAPLSAILHDIEAGNIQVKP